MNWDLIRFIPSLQQVEAVPDELAAGTYEVTLGPPSNFKPKQRTVVLTGTTVLKPKKVKFELL